MPATDDIIGSARHYIRKVDRGLEDPRAPEPRFTVHFNGRPGAGSGGTAGVTALNALRYLDRLAVDRSVTRYGLTSIEVRFEVADTVFES